MPIEFEHKKDEYLFEMLSHQSFVIICFVISFCCRRIEHGDHYHQVLHRGSNN